MTDPDLREIARGIREFRGVKRKKGIGAVSEALGLDRAGRYSFGDDTAVIDLGDRHLLFSCDSINEELVEADPFFAGYSAVLVNVNDIAAMGGRGIAMMNVISSKGGDTALEIARGMRQGSLKFGVPVVGGHLNPNSTHNGVEVSIMGEAIAGKLISGRGAQPGDVIIMAADLVGRLRSSYRFAWDCTSQKSAGAVQKNLKILENLASKELVNSGRDISNPGVIGTLAMILEKSGAGGVVDLPSIPRPDGVSFDDWLKVYPGYGFVFTGHRSKADAVIALFREQGISASVIGEVTHGPKLLISHSGNEEIVFDFTIDGITGVKS